jgi:hypothetical protein
MVRCGNDLFFITLDSTARLCHLSIDSKPLSDGGAAAESVEGQMANGKPKREKVANRLYVGVDGKTVVEDEQDAQGVRFEELERKETVVAIWSHFNDDGKRLIGLFGLKTWIGNLFNQDLDLDEILARVDSVKAGQWPERQGVGGPRYDADKLATAIATVKGAADSAPFLKRIQEEKGYAAMAMKVTEVMDLYNKATGKSISASAL